MAPAALFGPLPQIVNDSLIFSVGISSRKPDRPEVVLPAVVAPRLKSLLRCTRIPGFAAELTVKAPVKSLALFRNRSPEFPVTEMIAEPVMQIGRASCRERV